MISLWNTDPDFNLIYSKIDNITIVDKFRCWNIWQLARQSQGNFAEVGVYKGGTAMLLASLGHPIYLFDTFQGMPEALPNIDHHKKGDFADTSLVAVQKLLAPYSNVDFCPGFFPDSAKSVESTFGFVHIDVDIYTSTKACCEWFYPRLLLGGVMVFDDYGFESCPGNKKAVDEYFGKNVIYLPQGHAMVIKSYVPNA